MNNKGILKDVQIFLIDGKQILGVHAPKSVDPTRSGKDVYGVLFKPLEHLMIKKFTSLYVKPKRNQNLDKNVRTRNVTTSGMQINGRRYKFLLLMNNQTWI